MLDLSFEMPRLTAGVGIGIIAFGVTFTLAGGGAWGLAPIALGMVFLAYGWRALRAMREIHAAGLRVRGRILGIRVEPNPDGPATHSVLYSYRVGGRDYEGYRRYFLESPIGRWRVGSDVTVIVDREDLGRSVLPDADNPR